MQNGTSHFSLNKDDKPRWHCENDRKCFCRSQSAHIINNTLSQIFQTEGWRDSCVLKVFAMQGPQSPHKCQVGAVATL